MLSFAFVTKLEKGTFFCTYKIEKQIKRRSLYAFGNPHKKPPLVSISKVSLSEPPEMQGRCPALQGGGVVKIL